MHKKWPYIYSDHNRGGGRVGGTSRLDKKLYLYAKKQTLFGEIDN